MRNPANGKRLAAGFTVVEVMVSSLITVVVVAGVLAVFVQGMRVWERESITGELNMDLELAMERIRSDLRLSSVGIGLMSFYPEGAPDYTAISIPMAYDTDNDGLLDRNGDGKITWNRTIIYHVRPGDPDKLLRSEFWPRYTNATPEMIYQQLSEVVESATDDEVAAAALSGEQAHTDVVFKNLVDLFFYPPDARYDLYAPVRTKGRTFNWGSVVLDGGMHTLTFTVSDKNAASSGYNIEVDRIRLSNTGSDREGEIYVPGNTHPRAPYYTLLTSNMTVGAAQRSSGWSFSGNCDMVGHAGTNGAIAEFKVYNDLWCDNGFDSPGAAIASNCSVKFDQEFTNMVPYIPDVVVTMDKGITWSATALSDTNTSEIIAGTTLQVEDLVYGGTNDIGALTLNGRWARLGFMGGDGAPTYITNAVLIDEASGLASNVTFKGGAPAAYVPARGLLWSDWVPDFEIDREENYRVAFQVGGIGDLDLELWAGGNSGRLWYNENVGTTMMPVWGPADAAWQGLDYGSYCAPAFVDIDSDGDQDLFMGGWYEGQIHFYRNRGTPETPHMTLEDPDWNTIRHPLSRPTFADIDADGDYDAFIGGQNGRLEFVENIGSPAFPAWAPVDTFWMGIQVYRLNNPTLSLHYSAPAFADIDADGDLDLFVGRFEPGDLTMYLNTGSATVPAWGVTNSPYAGLIVGGASVPAFADIDADGDLDLFVGAYDGRITMFGNTGTPSAAVWGITNMFYNGIDVGSWATPALANINPDINSLHREIVPGETVAYTNGSASSSLVSLYEVEVGYPDEAIFRSGIFDTRMTAPEYNELNWTQIERFSDGGDIDIRIRSSDLPNMSDLTDADWEDAKFGDDGYFGSNTGNSLATLPRRRYVQYEARLRCFKSEAHTNSPTAILRDVTIDWPGPVGLVDLLVDFGKGPDCGIVTALVDGQLFVKGVGLEMEIYKRGRLGMFSTSGSLEVRPLNTGK